MKTTKNLKNGDIWKDHFISKTPWRYFAFGVIWDAKTKNQAIENLKLGEITQINRRFDLDN